MITLGRFLVMIGLATAFIGAVLWLGGRLFPWLGNLPGDLSYEGENVKIYIPLVTMILISVLGTILLNLFIRFFRR